MLLPTPASALPAQQQMIFSSALAPHCLDVFISNLDLSNETVDDGHVLHFGGCTGQST